MTLENSIELDITKEYIELLHQTPWTSITS